MGGRLLDGCDDAPVGSAAADVAVHVVHNLVAAGVRSLGQQRHTGDDHAGGTVAALHGVLFKECVLEGMVDAFDGGDLFGGGSAHGCNAGTDRLSVEQDGACAALAFAASILGAGQRKMVAEDGEEGDVGVG